MDEWSARAAALRAELAQAHEQGQREKEQSHMVSFPFDLSGFQILENDLPDLGVNAQYAAPNWMAATEPDPEIHVVPTSGPKASETFDHWWADRLSDFEAEKAHYNAVADQILEKHGAPTPKQLAPTCLPTILKWHRLVRDQWDKLDADPDYEFDGSGLPWNTLGPDGGLDFSYEKAIAAEYRGEDGTVIIWQVTPLVNGRCSVVRWGSPQDFTEVKLTRMKELFRRRHVEGRCYTDLSIVFEYCIRGITLGSSAPPRIKIAYNHSPFWQNRGIAAKKYDEKMSNFQKPRFSEPTDMMSCFPGELHPSSFALEQLNPDGSPKPRLTTNLSQDGNLPRELSRIGKKRTYGQILVARDGTKHQDKSLNAMVNQSDPTTFPPPLKFMRLKVFNKGAAILMSAGLPLTQGAEDLVAYYEQNPRDVGEHHLVQQWLVKAGPVRNPRQVFGAVRECASSNRLNISWTWLIEEELADVQRQFESYFRRRLRELLDTNLDRVNDQLDTVDNLLQDWKYNSSPAISDQELCATDVETAEQIPLKTVITVMQWTAYRRWQGFTGQWAYLGTFFDDTGSITFSWYDTVVRRTQFEIWRTELNLQVADGSMNSFTGKPFGQKEQRVGPDTPFTLLGRNCDINPPGTRSFDVAKRKRYADSGNALVAEARKLQATPIKQKRKNSSKASGFRRPSISTKAVQKFKGQIGFLAEDDPLLRACWQEFMSGLKPGWEAAPHVELHRKAQNGIEHMIYLLDQARGVAFLPRSFDFTSQNTALWIGAGDAARVAIEADRSVRYAGFGGYFMRRYSRHVFFYFDRLSVDEQDCSSTAGELFNLNVLAGLAGPRMRSPAAEDKHLAVSDKVPFTIVSACDNHSAGADSGNTLHASASEQRSLIRQRVLILRTQGIRAPCVHINREHASIKAGDDLSRALVEDFKNKLRALFDDPHLTFERVNIPSSLRKGLLEARQAGLHTAQLRG